MRLRFLDRCWASPAERLHVGSGLCSRSGNDALAVAGPLHLKRAWASDFCKVGISATSIGRHDPAKSLRRIGLNGESHEADKVTRPDHFPLDTWRKSHAPGGDGHKSLLVLV